MNSQSAKLMYSLKVSKYQGTHQIIRVIKYQSATIKMHLLPQYRRTQQMYSAEYHNKCTTVHTLSTKCTKKVTCTVQCTY